MRRNYAFGAPASSVGTGVGLRRFGLGSIRSYNAGGSQQTTGFGVGHTTQRPRGVPDTAVFFSQSDDGSSTGWQYPDGTIHFFGPAGTEITQPTPRLPRGAPAGTVLFSQSGGDATGWRYPDGTIHFFTRQGNEIPMPPEGAPPGATLFSQSGTGQGEPSITSWRYADGTVHFFGPDGKEIAQPTPATTGTDGKPSATTIPTGLPATSTEARDGGATLTGHDPSTGMVYYTLPNGRIVAYNSDGSFYGASAEPSAPVTTSGGGGGVPGGPAGGTITHLPATSTDPGTVYTGPTEDLTAPAVVPNDVPPVDIGGATAPTVISAPTPNDVAPVDIGGTTAPPSGLGNGTALDPGLTEGSQTPQWSPQQDPIYQQLTPTPAPYVVNDVAPSDIGAPIDPCAIDPNSPECLASGALTAAPAPSGMS